MLQYVHHAFLIDKQNQEEDQLYINLKYALNIDMITDARNITRHVRNNNFLGLAWNIVRNGFSAASKTATYTFTILKIRYLKYNLI